MNKKLLVFIVLFFMPILVSAIEFTPQGNINGRNIYSIYNFNDLNVTTLYLNGSQITANASGDITSVVAGTGLTGGGLTADVTLNVSAATCNPTTQKSVYNGTSFTCETDGGGGADTIWDISTSNYLYNNSNILDLNETKLNATIDNRDSDTTYSAGTGLSLTGTTFSLTYLFLSNFTNDLASLNWTKLQNYPSACSANTYVTQIDDSITCTAVTASGVSNFNTTVLSVATVYNDTTAINAKHTPADCPSGEFVQNTTTSGVECATPAGGTTLLDGIGIDINASNNINIVLAYRMPQSCNDGEIAEYNTSSGGWDCAIDNSAASGMASWVLASSDTGGSESITDGETVTMADDNKYLNATRSTNTITYTLYETALNATIDARDSDTTYTATAPYIVLTGTAFSWNETKGNATYINNGESAGGDLGGTYPNPTVDDNSHLHAGENISSGTIADARIASTLTRDTELDNTTIIRTTTSAGGDLSGTYPNPSVVDDSHNHVVGNIDAASSATWAGQITDESGTGVFAFTTSPTFTTPVLGAATATTLDTGQGANELYDMNQNVLTTSIVTFDTVTSTNGFGGALNWTYLQNYPAACSAGTFVTTNGDSNTCTAPTAADIDPGTYPSGNYKYQGNLNITQNLTVSGYNFYDNGTHMIWD